MEYKDTLLMPKTDFEMRGNLTKKEPGILEKWNKLEAYHKLLKTHEGQPSFVLHDGPPYANGNLHAGTAMNRIIKDIIVRSHAMNGFYTPFFPGWDTHGLPIENAIQKLGVDRKKISAAEFRNKCEEFALSQLNTQRETMKRLGTWADFDHPYVTLNKDFEARQIESFAKMAMDGLIYQGLKPIYWSPAQETAIADSEIVYFDKKDPTVFVSFEVVDTKGVLEGDERFVIWTTTPWTLPANLAICLNEGLTYVCVQTEKGKLIVAQALVEKLLEKFQLENQRIVATYKGKQLENILVQHPLYADRTSLIILGNHVTDEDGTGCVHTAPGHGADDFFAGMKYGLKAFCPVDEKGCMTIAAGEDLEGLFVDDCSKKVITKLNESGHLLHVETIVHSYPHDERLKKPVIFRATVQWFASIEKIREQLLSQISNVTWHNEWGEVRLRNMIRDRGDWCISRQRLWGVPIPILYTEDKTPIMDEAVFAHIANLVREYGSNVWFEREAKDLLPSGYTHPSSPNGLFTKETDIMDVWFDSGSSHNELEARGLHHPCDLYFEGSDQYRGWFNSSLIVSTATKGHAPYKSVLSHGYVCDAKGEKMSKSVGNVVDPIKIVNQAGADILRLWASSIDFKQDMRIGDDAIKQVSEQYRKVRNTFRFMLGNVHVEDFNPQVDRVAYEDMCEVDQYMEIRLDETVQKAVNAYMSYDFNLMSQTLSTFMINELSSYYLDFTKDILYIEKKDDARRRAVQTVIWDCINALARCWAPSLAFTMEEVWTHFTNSEDSSIHFEEFVKPQNYANAQEVKAKFARLFELRDDVLKALEVARADKVIGKPLEASLVISLNEEDQALVDNTLAPYTAQWFIVSEVIFAPNKGAQYQMSQIEVTKAPGEVCPRCWNVSVVHAEDGLCPRCQKVVHG